MYNENLYQIIKPNVKYRHKPKLENLLTKEQQEKIIEFLLLEIVMLEKLTGRNLEYYKKIV